MQEGLDRRFASLRAGRKRNLGRLHLAPGRHFRFLPGRRCAMEAVAYYARERHSDRPRTASPLVASYIRPLNDAWNDEDRQRLKELIPLLVGSNHMDQPGREYARVWRAIELVTRAWLLAEADAETGRAERRLSARLRALPPIDAECDWRRLHGLLTDYRARQRSVSKRFQARASDYHRLLRYLRIETRRPLPAIEDRRQDRGRQVWIRVAALGGDRAVDRQLELLRTMLIEPTVASPDALSAGLEADAGLQVGDGVLGEAGDLVELVE